MKLAENITTAAEYAAYRAWALNLEGATPEEVKASPNAWLMYALNTDKLIIAAPENGNVKFTVTPKMENGEKPDSFFFRVKMK